MRCAMYGLILVMVWHKTIQGCHEDKEYGRKAVILKKVSKISKHVNLDSDIWTFIKSMAEEERIMVSTWINSYFSAMMRQAAEDRAAAESSVNAKRKTDKE